MSKSSRLSSLRSLVLLPLLLAACEAPGVIGEPSAEDVEQIDPTSAQQSPILGGSVASAYAEAALITMYQGSTATSVCSGALVAPRVVLTAGHCIEGFTRWQVTLPYAQKQTATTTRAATVYQGTGDTVNPQSRDVGVLLLDAPLTLPSFPLLQKTKVGNGTQAVNVGRINNGQMSMTDLFVSKPLGLSDGTAIGYPYSYYNQEVIESGDSGGPVVLAGSSPHTIVAVNSGAGGGTQVLARVDLMSDWLTQQINANGGPGSSTGGSGGAGGSGGSGSSGSSGQGGSAGSTCAGGVAEVEPNPSSQPQRIQGSVCGKIGASTDEDWFLWSASASGVGYAFEAQGSGVELRAWKRVGGQFYPLSNVTPQKVASTSNGPGDYFVAVWSPTGQTVPYRLQATFK